jgi:electron transfer flavoprotein beta subunit
VKILVCVKQVLDPEGPVVIDSRHTRIASDQLSRYRMNRYDAYALEEALRIRESSPDPSSIRIDALSVGPERAGTTIRRALELGADEGLHVLLDDERWRTPFEIASLIVAGVGERCYDLILTGVMAEDDMQAQVGPMLAALLQYPCATAVVSQKVQEGRTGIYVEREREGGLREALEMRLPALLTIQSGINRLRYPALSRLMRARSRELITLPAALLAQPAPREQIHRLSAPAPVKSGVFLSGTPQNKAAALLRLLREKALV